MRRRNATPRNEREAQAKAVGTSPNTVWRYAGSALRQERLGGRVRAAAHDRIARRVNFITPKGKLAGTVHDSRTASALGEHLNAVKTFINNRGDSSALEKFEGKSFRISGQVYPFVTDPETLERLADAGELVFEGLYVAVKG